MVLAFLLVSGSCGLVYEILWMKMLTLVIGNTVFAITTVLTAFMGGLALGSFVAGRFIDKIKYPLRTYGILEGGIGLYALLLPLFIAGTEPLFRIIYQGINPSFYSFSLLRFVVCGIILLIPTTLMGATLPVLSKHFVERQSHVGLNVGLLYGLNTLGAVLGSFAAGFILIPTLGVTWTIYFAALLNLLICAGMLKLAKNRLQVEPSVSEGKPKGKKRKKERAEEVVPEGWGTIQWVVVAGIGISGTAAMIYQIAWTKVLLLSIGSSVYAFSLIVTAFICGLALGSLIISKFIDRRKDLVLWLALVQGAIGMSALLIVPLLGKLPVFVAETIFTPSNSFQYVHFAEFAIIFVLILIPTFMMGAAVPMAIKICTTDVRRVGRFFGNVYAVNTLGAILGSFIGGFILIPWVGAQNSIIIAVAMNIMIAGAIFLQAPTLALPRRSALFVATVVIAMVLSYLLPSWDASVLTSGPYLYADEYKTISDAKKIDLRAAMKMDRETLFIKEGLHAVVSVLKTPEGDLLLKVDGKADASAKNDAATQLMAGHLPLLLHQKAENVLVIGLGSGMTLGAVEKHPIKAADIVEIEPAVVEASAYFKDFTGDPLNDPRVNLIVGDGRNHLALTSLQYDVIISEPSNPWVSGQANLFTREFFNLAKKRLEKGGLMCQWVQAYSMSAADFKAIVHTFQSIFPQVTVWEAILGVDYLLIGATQDVQVDYPRLLEQLGDESIRPHLAKMRIWDPATFIAKLVLADNAVADYTRGALLNTDDNNRLAYSAPKVLLQGPSTLLMEEFYRFQPQTADMLKFLKGTEKFAPMENDLSIMFQAKKFTVGGYTSYAKGAVADAIEKFERALTISPKNYDATEQLAKLFYKIGNQYKKTRHPAEAGRAYEKSIRVINDFIAGDQKRLSGQFELEAIYAKAQMNLGIMALNANRLKQAAAALEKSVSGGVQVAEAHNNLGIVYARLGNKDAAAKHYQYAIKLNPNLISAVMNFGNLLLEQNKFEQAIACYLQVQKLKPDFAITNYNLGMAYFMQNQWQKAEAEWKRALALKPDFDQARQGLNVVRQKMGSL